MSDDEYTTDALPSPPRDQKKSGTDDKKQTKHIESDEEQEEKFKDSVPPPPQNQATIHVVHVSNSTGIHIGNNIVFNSPDSKNMNRRSHSPPIVETKEIKSLQTSTKPVTQPDIEIVSDHMGEGWKETARSLGFSDSAIYTFEYRNHYNLKEVLYDLLKDWMQDRGPHKATVGILAQTLWDTKQREAVKMWSLRYNKTQK